MDVDPLGAHPDHLDREEPEANLADGLGERLDAWCIVQYAEVGEGVKA